MGLQGYSKTTFGHGSRLFIIIAALFIAIPHIGICLIFWAASERVVPFRFPLNQETACPGGVRLLAAGLA